VHPPASAIAMPAVSASAPTATVAKTRVDAKSANGRRTVATPAAAAIAR
jgi:hypothetical protein